MAIRRLSDLCEDRISCPGVWGEDEYPEDIVAVGKLVDPSPVPLGPGMVAIRLPRRVVRGAKAKIG
jgi:hypothetical protein